MAIRDRTDGLVAVPRRAGQRAVASLAAATRKSTPIRPGPWLGALAGYTVAFFAVTWPLLTRFGHATYGGPGDGWALIWQTRFRLEHGISYFAPTQSTEVGWPVGASLPSALYLSNAAVELPNLLLLWLGFDDVVAYNLITVAAALTSSLAMYGALRRLGCRADVSFWGGLVYLLAPWHLAKLGIHPTLAFMAAFPLLILGVVEWTRRPGLKSGALVVAAAALGTYTHSYFGVAVGVMLAFTLVPVLLIAWRRAPLQPFLKRTALLAGALLLVPLPLGLALQLQSDDVSVVVDRPLYLILLAARPYLWFVPSTDNPVFGDWSRSYIESHALRLNEGELSLYLGLLTVALALVGAGIALGARRRLVPAAVASATAIGGVLFSLPAVIDFPLLGGVRMPIGYVSEVFVFISTPARFFVLTLTGATVVAALGLDWIARRAQRPWAAPIVLVACLISVLELPYHREGSVIDTRPPQIARAIEAEVPEGEPVAQYPSMASFYKPIADQLFHQLSHGRPLVNGAMANLPQDAVRLAVEDERAPETPSILALVGVRWATYDPIAAAEKARLIGTKEIEAYRYQPQEGFRVVRRLPDGSLLMRVTAKPPPAFVSLASGFTRDGRWLTRTSGTMLACAGAAGEYELRFIAGGFAQSRSITIGDGPTISIEPKIVPIRTRLRLREGWQFLEVQLIGSKPTRPSDAIPGEVDTRPVAASIGPISVNGPAGSPNRCHQAPPADEIPTVGRRAEP